MKKILNILSGLSLSVSLPLTLVACDKKNDETEEPPTKPKPVVAPIKKFESFKDFLRANTYLGKENALSFDDWNDPKWNLYEALANNNFKIFDDEFIGTSQEQFYKKISQNLSNNRYAMEYVFDHNSSATKEPPEFDFVDAKGEKIFWKVLKMLKENTSAEYPIGWHELVRHYNTVMPRISFDTSVVPEDILISIFTDKDAALTYKNFHYIQFRVYKSSWLWDLKPEKGRNYEVLYMGNDDKEGDIKPFLKPYEDTCDMPWLANNQWCKEE